MGTRIASIAFNTFREAVRDRVLYNLIFFAVLMVAASLLVGQISIGIERIVLINLGLTAISIFGIVIAVFIGIGLVSKEIEKRTLYTLLSRPVQRWEFIVGKYWGLSGTLIVNAALMAVGFFAVLLYQERGFSAPDAYLLVAIYLIILQFFMMTSIALLFSTFSSPLLSAVMAFALFVAGSFGEDLRALAAMTEGIGKWLLSALSYVLPNFAAMNVISSVAHDRPVAGSLVLYNTLYALLYSLAALSGAVLIFQRRNLK